MLIETADKSGFCFGVQRAIDLTGQAADKYGEVFTLGPLIHNTIVTDSLEKRGVHIAADVQDAQGKPLVIRSHGVGRDTEERAQAVCSVLLDATCPFVKRIHKIVSEQPADSTVIILGDGGHPEVQGIMGHANCRAAACMALDEVRSVLDECRASGGEAILVVQTTFDRSRFLEYSEIIREEYSCVKIYDTICNATSERQANAEELAKRADLMLVVGGRHSSNTGKLAEICSRYCRTVFIESASELSPQIISGLHSDSIIGITAGASTPAYTIKEVHLKMSEIINNNENEESFAALFEQSESKRLYNGAKVKATVVSVKPNEAVVELGTKHTGYIPLDELTNDPNAKVEDIVKVGDEIDAIVTKVDDSQGVVFLSKKRVDSALGMEKIAAAKEANETLEGVVTQAVKGGVIVVTNGTRVFIPASQTGVPRSGKLEDLVKKTVQFKVIEINEQRHRAFASIRAVLREERKAKEDAFWANVEVGKHYMGTVKNLATYGAFVDLGGVDGMVHNTELSWKRIKHPSQVVKVGDVIDVYVKDFNRETGKISLGYKTDEMNSWYVFKNKYNVGDVATVKIVSFTPFGAFAEIVPGTDGLIHISQISKTRIAQPSDVLEIGEEVEVKIIDIDEEKQKVSLSIRALIEDAEAAAAEEAAEDAEAVAEADEAPADAE